MTPDIVDTIGKLGLGTAAIIALIVIFKEWTKNLRMQEDERKELLENQRSNHIKEMKKQEEANEMLQLEIERLRENGRKDHEEYKNDRKEWLLALNSNTEVLKEVANMIRHLPRIEDDMIDLKEDVSDIKKKIESDGRLR